MSHTPAFYTCDSCGDTEVEPLIYGESTGHLPYGWTTEDYVTHLCGGCQPESEET